MSVICPPPAGEDDCAADGTKAAAGNACGAGDSSGCRQSFSTPLPAPAPFETADAAALVFSLAAAALAARLSPLIALVVLAEGGFYLWQRYRHRLIQAEPVLDAAIEPERLEMLKERLLSLSEIISLDDFLSGWFRGASRKSILRGNVEDFIAYGFYARRLEDLGPDDRREVSAFVERIEERYATSFAPGRTAGLRFMAHLWEPLRVIHSPLALRLALEGMRLFSVLVLGLAGFRRGRVEIAEGARGGRGSSYEFWVLPPAAAAAAAFVGKGAEKRGEASEEEEEESAAALAAAPDAPLVLPLRTGDRDNGVTPPSPSSSAPADGGGDDKEKEEEEEEEEEEFDGDDDDDPSAAPILFLHGVGLGIAPYLLFVASLRRRFPRRPLLLLEARHVSVGLFPARAASTCDVAAAALEAMRIHGWGSAAVVAHSYGTFVAARVLASRPSAVQSLVLLDPVCALTIYPQLLANFVYKPPLALLKKSEDGEGEKQKGGVAESSRSRSGYFWPRQEEEEDDDEEREASPSTSRSSSFAPPLPPPPPPPSPSRLTAVASAAASAARTARALLTAVDSARFLFSRDLAVAEAICRRFAWHRECLWPQDLRHGGRSTLLGLAAGDDLVPGDLVRRALAAAGSRALVSGNEAPGAGHGGFLLDRKWQGRLLDGAEAVIEAGAREERAEKREEEEERRRKRGAHCGDSLGLSKEAPSSLPLAFGDKEKATAASASAFASAAVAGTKLVDNAPNTPARPATADLGEERRRRRPDRRSFSRQRVVPVVLETAL